MKNKMTWEEGLSILKPGIEKAMMILDGYPTSALFTCEQYMQLYDCVYDMCVHMPPYEYCKQLYELFKKALEESITSKVIPALKGKSHISLLIEVCNVWAKYKVMTKCLGGFFLYLDRHVAEDTRALSLNSLSICCFHDMVFKEVYPTILQAALDVISQDRDENSGCNDLLKNVSTLFVEIGDGKMYYYDNFEAAILAKSADYYNQLLFELLPHYSPVDYIQQAHRCFNQEKERASQFLNQTSVEKLLQVVQEQLLGQNAMRARNSIDQAACGDGSNAYQEVLLGCAGLNLGEGGSQNQSMQEVLSGCAGLNLGEGSLQG